MNWFNLLMDDFKKSLIHAKENQGIFLPALIQAGLSVVLGVIFVILIYVFVILGVMVTVIHSKHPFALGVGSLAIISVAVIVFSLFSLAFSTVFQVGTIYLIKQSLQGKKPTKQNFITGVKTYFLNIFGTNLIFSLLVSLCFLILLVFILFYVLTVGILSAGWGILILPVLFNVFLGTWIIIAVEENCSGYVAIKKSIRIGKKQFKTFFLLFFSMTAFSYGFGQVLGTLSLLAMPVLTMIIITFYNLLLMTVYQRVK